MNGSKWTPINNIDVNLIPEKILPWIIDEQSMTQAMRRVCKNMTINVLSQQWCKPTLSEILYLQLDPSQDATIREIEMLGDGEVWVYARTILPPKLVYGQYRDLFLQLGRRSIGDILYSHEDVKRFDIEVAHLTSIIPGYESMRRYNGGVTDMWTRRAKFHLFDCDLSVSEVIFPTIEEYKPK